MQDFTKSYKAKNDNSTLVDKQKKWLTKDRFWTFVFWFGMSFGCSITSIVSGFGKKTQVFSYWSPVLFWLTLLGIPLILKIFNNTKFIKPLTFTNSEGYILTEEQRPYLFMYMIFAGLPTAFVVAEMILPRAAENFITALILFICTFAPVSLYFIYKNCPISILFNRKFWTIEGNPNVARLKTLVKIIKDD